MKNIIQEQILKQDKQLVVTYGKKNIVGRWTGNSIFRR